MNIVFCAISGVLLLSAFIYVIFFATFTVANLNADMMLAFGISLPLLALSVAVHVPRLYLVESSCQRELDVLLDAAKKGYKPTAPVSPGEFKNEALIKRASCLIVLAVAVIFVVVGIFNGGMDDVLGKAVKICTECIGLG